MKTATASEHYFSLFVLLWFYFFVFWATFGSVPGRAQGTLGDAKD